MRYRLMATYRGVPYEAGVGPTDEDVVLFAACPPPEELGFAPATGHWRKQVRKSDVQSLWESRPMGRFRGEGCVVLDDLGDKLHIAYLGHDSYRAEQLGYWEVDRGVFELMTHRDEVTEIVEERRDFPPHPAVPGTPGQAGGIGGSSPLVSTAGGIGGSSPLISTAEGIGWSSPLASTVDGGGPSRSGVSAGDIVSAGDTVPPEDTGPPEDIGPPEDTGSALAGTAANGHAGLSPGALFAPMPATGPTGRVERDLAPDRERPLPLEEAARLAASARAAVSAPSADLAPAAAWEGTEPARRRGTADRQLATQRTFCELAGLAAIPPSAFAVGEEVDGAMCLIQTLDGYEVFNAADGARHEVRVFDDEESAYFYLFGVLAAEAVRTGRLAPPA
jgi:hypothetical protein